ncbi:MAG: response regulator transcription factor [Bdellovibrio sp.]|nr:response regulator transcription factor [Bdellovibrio sp.]
MVLKCKSKQAIIFLMYLLIVDDDQDFCQNLKKVLSEFGEIFLAGDIKSSYKILETRKIDLLIADYFLPDGNGLELIQLSKKKMTQQKSILMSGSTTKEIAIASVNMQISGLIEKPFAGTEIKKMIKELFKTSGIEINEKDHEVKINKLRFSLTPTEFKIFKYLHDHCESRVSRKEISEKIWGDVVISDNVFDTHLGNIKRKMGPYSEMLTNIKSVGYSLDCLNPTEQ